MQSSQVIAQVDLIRQVFRYAHRFRGKTFVIHVDLEDAEERLLTALVRDLVLLHQAGIRIVLVPAARQRIDEVLERYGVGWARRNGIRIASAEAMPFIKMAAFDVTNRYMTALSAQHTNAVVGNWVRARGIGVIDGVDYEHAGVVERVQLDLLRSTLLQDSIPIFPCIGWSVSGKPYNISSRELAFRIALSLEADKLFFVAPQSGITAQGLEIPPGVEVGADDRISRLTVDEARSLLSANGVEAAATVPGGEGGGDGALQVSGYHDGERERLEFVRLAWEATRRAVDRVHIVDARIEGVILIEVFSSLGVGTMVYANVYESIRPMRGEEIADVHRLIQPLSEMGVLVSRSRDDIAARRDDYVVYETDGRVLGCGALHEYAGGEAEIAAIAVDSAYEELGIGRRIVLYLMQTARERGLRGVFVLTTKTGDWFESIGYVQVPVDRLPEEKRRRYDVGRNSRVLYHALSR